MGDARAKAIFEADDSPLYAACMRANSSIMGLSQRFNVIKKFLIGAAPIAGVIAGIAKIDEVLGVGKELADTKAQTGMAAEEILKLRKEFKRAGVDAENMPSAINKMQKSLTTGSASAAVAKLGLNMEELRKKTPSEQFHTIGKAIAGMADPAQRAALAMQVFGKTGASLLPVFSNKEFGNVQLKTGDILLAKNADLFADTKNKIETLKPSLQSLWVGMADQIIPVIRPLLDQFQKMDFAKIGQDFAAPIAQIIQLVADGKFWNVAGDVLILCGENFINALWKGIQTLGPLLGAVLENDGEELLMLLQFCTHKDFWVGLGNALIAIGSEFNALLLDGIAWVLEKLAKAPLIGGKDGKMAAAAASTRQLASDMRSQRDETGKAAMDMLTPYAKQVAEQAQKNLENIVKTAADGYSNASNVFDTKDQQKKVDAELAANKERVKETSAKSLADAKPAEATRAVADAAPVVSALQRIGGGGNYGGNDRLLSESQRQTGLLEKIHDALTPKNRPPMMGSLVFS